MPSGKGTYGNQVGRPPKQGNGMSSDEDLSWPQRLDAIKILLGTEDAKGPQPDWEAGLAEDDLARREAENALRQQMPTPSNLGNPTSRDFADPEIDEALRKQRLFY
jgi:hypothetical protein